MHPWITALQNMRRAIRHGGLFPGRPSRRPAPGGSRQPALRAPLSLRLSEEIRWFEVSEHDLPVAGLARPLSLLHLTDLHVRDANPDLQELCRRLRELRPDLLVLTGDVVARGWTLPALEQLLSALPPAPLGRFAVMGNWEYWSQAPPERWQPLLAQAGITLLHERWVQAGPVILAGTDDLLAGQSQPQALLDSLPPDHPAIVLTHSPEMFPHLVDPRVKLVLSGHTHGGQVCLPGIGALWVPRGTGPYIGGWYNQGESWLYVSRGLGWSVAPLRLFCPPELVWIRLLPLKGSAPGDAPG